MHIVAIAIVVFLAMIGCMFGVFSAPEEDRLMRQFRNMILMFIAAGVLFCVMFALMIR